METVEERLKSLMLLSLGGDERSYRILLDETGRRLRSFYLRRLGDTSVADDLVQETLIAVHTRRATYDRDRPFTVWLYAIARYKLVDHIRRSKRRSSVSLDDVPEAFLAAEEAEPASTAGDLEQILASAPPIHREMVRAVKLEGRSIAEVAAARGMSESAVKVTIHRAIKRLAKTFNGDQAP